MLCWDWKEREREEKTGVRESMGPTATSAGVTSMCSVVCACSIVEMTKSTSFHFLSPLTDNIYSLSLTLWFLPLKAKYASQV